ncbi:MAG: LLM class flavin-dependent oxidoreductase [Gemmatimonadales bacterium]
MIPLSILDLASIVEGGNASIALANTLDLARRAEALGYRRFWLAEHHNMTGIASAATSVVIAHVAAGTSTIRVGAGGVMLPNHAPLLIAEQFGTLAALHPGRIDLGLGRAPGSDPATSRALRRDAAAAESFPQDVVELLHWFEPAVPGQTVQAVPGAGLDVPIWILGSSLFGAQLAAALGLPFAFASHFAPRLMGEAIALYRSRFEPSRRQGALAEPYVMLGVNVVAADTDEAAQFQFTTLQQMFVNVRRGRPGPLPPPRAGVLDEVPPWERAGMEEMLAVAVVGSPDTVRRGVDTFVERTGADELMVVTPLFDHAARLHSFELLMAATREPAPVR